mmetsp:Transcript_61155/g.145664  ORF Transcript_61155/g.145664 Transcript_61155/m.145664 type:complete len:90 (+) Transcript_61155:906-1175(+)
MAEPQAQQLPQASSIIAPELWQQSASCLRHQTLFSFGTSLAVVIGRNCWRGASDTVRKENLGSLLEVHTASQRRPQGYSSINRSSALDF